MAAPLGNQGFASRHAPLWTATPNVSNTPVDRDALFRRQHRCAAEARRWPGPAESDGQAALGVVRPRPVVRPGGHCGGAGRPTGDRHLAAPRQLEPPGGCGSRGRASLHWAAGSPHPVPSASDRAQGRQICRGRARRVRLSQGTGATPCLPRRHGVASTASHSPRAVAGGCAATPSRPRHTGHSPRMPRPGLAASRRRAAGRP